MIKKLVVIILVVGFYLYLYSNWFASGLLTSGDFWPLFSSMYSIREFPLSAWDFNANNGFGGFSGPFLWIHFNLAWPVMLFNPLRWEIIERVFYLFPFLVLVFISPFLLFRTLFRSNFYAVISALIYSVNTYILLIVSGGQIISIGLSYTLIPLVFLVYFLLQAKPTLRFGVIAGLLLGIQTVLDIRIAYITFFTLGIFLLLSIQQHRFTKQFFFFGFLLPGVITILLNCFWLLPSLLVFVNPFEQLGSAYSSSDAVRFFSFAKLEQTISLLHPNWPENIFGKVGFMQPEFLLLPIIAFSSLFFVSSKQNSKNKFAVLFLLVVGIIGVFLAKGANDPLGQLYVFLFNHLPGFRLFRDPSKWYVLIAVSYAFLIPFVLLNLPHVVFGKNIKKYLFIVPLLFLIYFGYTIRPVLLGQIGGLFKTQEVPIEYRTFEKYFSSDPSFSRIFWVPTYSRFSYYSLNHPAIIGANYYGVNSADDTIEKISKEGEIDNLARLGIGYIVVPFDSQGEIFLNDRKYDEKQYLQAVKRMRAVEDVREIKGFGRNIVFQISNQKSHFWSTNANIQKVSLISPTEYKVDLMSARKGEVLVFNERFDPHWVLIYDSVKIKAREGNKVNTFILPRDGNYFVTIKYLPQTIVNIGSIISAITVCLLILVITSSYFKKKI